MALTARDIDYNVEYALRTIFRRCVQCPTDQAPSCPACPSGQMCAQTPTNCNQCASTECVPIDSDSNGGNTNKKSGPNVGAIAGGTVGAVVFLAIAGFIFWKFCIKGRRRRYPEEDWQQVDQPGEKVDNDFASRRSARASTHTVASMASSIMTRASNIIQIAYIPGVTNRSGPGSPDVLVPPVPPIPSLSPSTALSSPYSEQHFFVPDLRDSTYSDGRSSYARTSITPSLARSSVATTIYRNNAIVSPLPAQTVVRGKAAVVSVKSSGSTSPAETPGSETPPVPKIDSKFSASPMRIQMPRMTSNSSLSPQNSVRSTATLGPVRALNITKKGKATSPSSGTSTPKSESTAAESSQPTPIPMRPLTEVSVASSEDVAPHARARQTTVSMDSDSSDDEDSHSRARRSLLRNSSNPRDSEVTDIQDTPGVLQSPFTDAARASDSPDLRPDPPQRHASRSSAAPPSLSTVMEESSKRGSRASARTQSPFGDEHQV